MRGAPYVWQDPQERVYLLGLDLKPFKIEIPYSCRVFHEWLFAEGKITQPLDDTLIQSLLRFEDALIPGVPAPSKLSRVHTDGASAKKSISAIPMTSEVCCHRPPPEGRSASVPRAELKRVGLTILRPSPSPPELPRLLPARSDSAGAIRRFLAGTFVSCRLTGPAGAGTSLLLK
ncbi:MAG: hypothetical protein Kow001_03700 [Acidobacteriota bacterium]